MTYRGTVHVRAHTRSQEVADPSMKRDDVKTKNEQAKMRKIDNPYETWTSPDGAWTWLVLKKYQKDDDKPYARWFCAVKSPATFGSYDMGDVYVKDIKENATKTGENP